MKFKEIFKIEHFNKLLVISASAAILIFVFSAGVFIGHGKARFSQNWGENYYRNIIGHGKKDFNGFIDFGRQSFGAHEGFGVIIKIDGNSIIIKDQSNIEKTILITDQTAIIKDRQNIKISDFKIDDKIVAVGKPNEQGQIEPKLIRVLPSKPRQ